MYHMSIHNYPYMLFDTHGNMFVHNILRILLHINLYSSMYIDFRIQFHVQIYMISHLYLDYLYILHNKNHYMHFDKLQNTVTYILNPSTVFSYLGKIDMYMSTAGMNMFLMICYSMLVFHSFLLSMLSLLL